MEENITIEPKYGFYSVTVEVETEDSETGKIKKVKEEHLVDGRSCTEVEQKVKKEMEGTLGEWKIVKCQTSKITIVY
jgi:hypothetical protein